MRVTGVALRGLSLLILWTKALWIITEERWLGSCSLWQAGLHARSRNAVINVQLCKWWMACEGWNLPSTTLAKINRGSTIRADPGLWRYPPFAHVSLDFQLPYWPISREAAKTFRDTLWYFRRSITLMFTVALWNGIMCSDSSEWRFVIAFHAIRGEIMEGDHENEEIKMTNGKTVGWRNFDTHKYSASSLSRFGFIQGFYSMMPKRVLFSLTQCCVTRLSQLMHGE